MQTLKPTLAIVGLVAATLPLARVHAQVSTTSPAGFEKTAGNVTTSFGVGSFFGNTTASQSLVIDDTQRGKAGTIKALWLRRSMQAPDNTTSVGGKVDMTLRIGEGDFSKVKFARQSFSEFVVGAWTTGMAARKVDMPDLRKRPANGPAAWSLRLPLDRPYSYGGQNALLVQLNAFGTTATPLYPFDAARDNSRSVTGTPVGAGCKIGTMEFTSEVTTTVTAGLSTASMSIVSRPMSGSLSSRNAFALIGATNPNLTAPGFCAALLSSGEILVPMSSVVFDSRSIIIGRAALLRVPYSNSLVGTRAFVQAFTLDRSAPGGVIIARGFHTAPFPARPTTSDKPCGGFSSIIIRGTASFLSSATLTRGFSTILGIER